jgi:hypothetical protein
MVIIAPRQADTRSLSKKTTIGIISETQSFKKRFLKMSFRPPVSEPPCPGALSVGVGDSGIRLSPKPERHFPTTFLGAPDNQYPWQQYACPDAPGLSPLSRYLDWRSKPQVLSTYYILSNNLMEAARPNVGGFFFQSRNQIRLNNFNSIKMNIAGMIICKGMTSIDFFLSSLSIRFINAARNQLVVRPKA